MHVLVSYGPLRLASADFQTDFRIFGICCVFALLVASAAGAAALDFRNIWSGECHFSQEPFTAQIGPQQAVFTARILQARKLWGPDDSPWSSYWRRYGLLASVQKQFWGLRWWDRRLVILLMSDRGSGVPPPPGEIDFVDGRRLPGALTRVLRDGPPQNGVRILGRTVRLTGDYPNYRWERVASAKVWIRGPAGLMTLESDAHGTYDVEGLPAGLYEISRPPTDGAPPAWQDVQCRWNINVGEIRDCGVNVK